MGGANLPSVRMVVGERALTHGYTILAPGFAKWWGSDARALGQALRRLGHSLIDLDEEDYVSWRAQGVGSKLVRRLFGSIWIDDYNRAVLRQKDSSGFDFVLVFKGNLVKEETLRQLSAAGKPIYNFYPDVSFSDHGPNIPASLKHYDVVFTTKSYHGGREVKQFGIRRLEHVRHGFDPEVHRPLSLSAEIVGRYQCDVSFVGCWSREKEERLLYLLRNAGQLRVMVFGLGWRYASQEFRERLGDNLRPGVFGDELAMVYQASRINLGLLSSSQRDSSLRDQTTARTFQIPATASFMLHEDTPEVRELFADGKEVMLFSSNEEMVEKIVRAIASPELRRAVSRAGYQRCQLEPYDYQSAATDIIRVYEESKPGISSPSSVAPRESGGSPRSTPDSNFVGVSEI